MYWKSTLFCALVIATNVFNFSNLCLESYTNIQQKIVYLVRANQISQTSHILIKVSPTFNCLGVDYMTQENWEKLLSASIWRQPCITSLGKCNSLIYNLNQWVSFPACDK